MNGRCLWFIGWLWVVPWLAAPAAPGGFQETCPKVWPKIAKIFGAGGLQRLHAYSSGILVSKKGHILTVWNHVLETPTLRVVLSDGQRFDATLQIVDSELNAAIIKVEAEDLPFFDLAKAPRGQIGEPVLAFSNAYRVATGNEKPTVIHGVLSAVTDLRARRGIFELAYEGSVYVIDGITNNPGASGGALTNRQGDILGMIGEEARSELTNTWLNYALPADVLVPLVRRALDGERSIPAYTPSPRETAPKAATAKHGIVFVPDVLRLTPAYVDRVEPGSPAEKAGIRPDDLLLFLQETFIGTVRNFREAIPQYRPGEKIHVLLKRKEEVIVIDLTLE